MILGSSAVRKEFTPRDFDDMSVKLPTNGAPISFTHMRLAIVLAKSRFSFEVIQFAKACREFMSGALIRELVNFSSTFRP